MTDRVVSSFETVIGTEVHLQLKTKTKMYCGCLNEFHAEPNTLICPVCTGQPGALPVINEKSYNLALIAAKALNCQIHKETRFDRKNYYYPDLPKGYRITQFFYPIATEGKLSFYVQDEELSCGIERIHIEEDAGKMTHQDELGESWVDYNRSGVPLIEIVSKPDLRSVDDTSAYLNELKLLLKHLQVSDCEMQEGSLRVDLNVNVHLKTNEGSVATPIVEVKNLNSFSSVRSCILYETERQQTEWIKTGQSIKHAPKETRGWNDLDGKTVPQRIKEGLADYRYFPEPDLPPYFIDEAILNSLPKIETPRQAIERIAKIVGQEKSEKLVKEGVSFVEAFDLLHARGHDAHTSVNLLTNEVLEALNEKHWQLSDLPIEFDQIGILIDKIFNKEFAMRVARQIFKKMIDTSRTVEAVMVEENLNQIDDDIELKNHCQKVITEFPKPVEDYLSGKEAALNGLMGRVMQKTKGKANPQKVKVMLKELLAQS